MKPLILCLAVLISQSALSADIYKCKDAKGRLTFSQTPCSPSAEKTTVQGPEMLGSVAADAETTSMLQDSRRLRQVENAIADKERELDSLSYDMDAELAVLKNRSRYANNNLAGATWQQSLAMEMQAVSQKYQARMESARIELQLLHDKKARLEAK